MKRNRRVYTCSLCVNGININRIIIDPHYEIRHSSVINDSLILELVQNLNGKYFDSNDEKKPYKYFVEEGIILRGKVYRLIWLLEEGQTYIGIVNVFRSSNGFSKC